jgi:predicted exporter
LPSERLLPRLFLILLLAVLACRLAVARRRAAVGQPDGTGAGHAPDALELRAEQRMQEPLNREMLVLVGHADRQQAVAMAQKLGERNGRPAGCSKRSSGTCKPTCRRCATAARPPGDALGNGPQQLIDHPDAFIQQRVQALFDPFTGFSLVPSQDDWLGLTGRIQNSQPQHGSVQLDIGSGALVADADGKSWVLLRARTTGNAFDMNLPLQVADLLSTAAKEAAGDVQLLAASGLLYAAAGSSRPPGK